MLRIGHALTMFGILAVLPLAPAQVAKETQHNKIEQALLELINQERVKEKLPPLLVDGKLIEAARAHSANMNKQRKMDHVLDGKTPTDRVEAVQYEYDEVNENLGFMPKTGNLPGLVAAWMKSPTHRPNILGKFAETGIGVVEGKGPADSPNANKDGYWITQLFANPVLNKDERALLDLMNATRAREKLPPLKVNDLLLKAARDHAANMAKQQKLTTKLDDKGTIDRIMATGYNFASCSENIDWHSESCKGKVLAEACLKMELLRKDTLGAYTEVGIGVTAGVKDNRKGVYVSVVFGRPLE